MAGGGEDSFIQSLGFLLGLTAILALFLSYLGQSTIIAFIATGVVVNAIGVEPEETTLAHMSEVGIVILLFMAGLEVDLGAFLKNWRTAAIIGVGQIVCSTGFFAALSLLILPAIGQEANRNSAVYFGLCLCFSSTILVLGYLKENKSMGTLHGQLCLGTLVLQDAASVLGIAVLGGLKESDDGSSGGIAASILILFGKLVAAMVIIIILERFVLNRLFSMFARSLELLYLGALGYATGLAALAVTAGFSGEITAFLAGVSISRLPYKMHIETKMEPIKALGVAVFFISLGLKLELGQEMLDALPIGFGLAVFTLFATLPLFAALGFLAGLKSHTVFMLGMLMNQISEFSLILCTLCVRAYVFEPVVLTVMTVAAVVSIIVSSMGHAHMDATYRRMQRWACLRGLDTHRAKKLLRENNKNKGAAAKKGKGNDDDDSGEKDSVEDGIVEAIPAADNGETGTGDRSEQWTPLSPDRPSHLGTAEDWAFEDQLKQRFTEQLEIDLKETEEELELAREAMAATADEKRMQTEQQSTDMPSKIYGLGYGLMGAPTLPRSNSSRKKSSSRPIIRTSHATDIMHGMIEGYVIVENQLMFCTLRAGRMLFWGDKHDVGHAPPASVWDVSGMAIIEGEDDTAGAMRRVESDLSLLESGAGGMKNSDSNTSLASLDASTQNELHPWEWTIVLGHIHRHTGTSSLEDDAMKLTIHGLEDHSDHDAQDWHDALAVATSTLNPIALRLAHIREELHSRHRAEGSAPQPRGFESRTASHSHRNEIICIGYNEMFPAVLALADAIGKEVVVVEYDPMKLKTIETLYSEEQRRKDFRDKKKKKKGKNNQLAVSKFEKPPMETVQEAYTTDDISSASSGDLDQGVASRRRRTRIRSMSMPLQQIGGGGKPQEFWAPNLSEDSNSDDGGEGDIKGVKCEYADIHDPECWEELQMDEAFMVVCTIKGARHAEKAILQWLKQHGSDAIFVACSQNNIDAMRMYKAGAHFVMQTDALAMRSTREIFLETVASFGDCSQLVAAGQSHKIRLAKLRTEDSLKFQYETGY
eukprot:CAMPEP_0183711958 /NCGR_PEP_ID=MMETSP0737-20130205/7271_1 /TAXON_ID=385413 /ORGANISM="Thalassiosira miniscula, Strain CCMP1093" /LENGTH=1045 /DNA_ID=CAMNT_0025940531 /DNA_START=202 /DNA_END=3342 /DNA_ORIENTATION=+